MLFFGIQLAFNSPKSYFPYNSVPVDRVHLLQFLSIHYHSVLKNRFKIKIRIVVLKLDRNILFST